MTKCTHCRKKVLVPMMCRCQNAYCIQHRTPETHNCTHDHKAEGAAQIAEKNPKIVATKVESI